MTCLKIAAILAALMLTAPSHAAEPLTGRWAADPSACAGHFFSAGPSPLIVTGYAVRWQGESCRIGRRYKAGETFYMEAFCWSTSGERSIPVSLRPQGQRLSLTWDRTARAELKRCQ